MAPFRTMMISSLTLPLLFLGSSTITATVVGNLQSPLSGISSPFDPASSSSHGETAAPPYRNELLSLHKQLVSIASVTDTENEIGHFLLNYLAERGFRTLAQTMPPSEGHNDPAPRFNVIAWPNHGRSSEPKVVVSSHIDTVPPHIPYSIDDGPIGHDMMIRGRGSVDAKASVAAQIIALTELQASEEDIPTDDVMLVYVVGEESRGDGMRFFSDSRHKLSPRVHLDAAIFGEPTEGKLACGHKGFMGCTIRVTGQAGHSGYPWLGKSATELLTRALVKILDADLGSSERYGNTTVNVGVLEGGVALNVIPEFARAKLAIRIAVGPQDMGGPQVEEKIRDILKEVDEEAIEMECTNGYGAVDCNCEVDGFKNITVNYGTDVPNLKGDHTRYLYGPGSIFVAHGPKEAIKLGDLEQAVEDYKKLIRHALKR